MEENIKLIEHYMEYYSKDYVFRKAVEKLIKGYKELEEETRKPLKVCIGRRNYGKTCEIRTFIEEDYISKSKVREKIEELDDIESEYSKKILNISKETATFTIFVQEILKQLLQEGDK